MIINNKTINGTDVFSLKTGSKEKVNRVCDLCGDEKSVQWNDIYRCRKKHNTDKDYCFKCSMKIYNTGDNNSAKNPEVGKKISKATKGKSKSFKDGKNLRILDRKISSSGHVLKWVEDENKHVQEHRLIVADALQKHHSQLLEVHHINGIKQDNRIDNLIELNQSEHASLHSQLEKLAFELVKNNFIVFNKSTKQYCFSPLLEIQTMEKSLGFENIAIKQKKNICNSRLDVNISSEIIRGIYRPIPLIAANMSTVVNSDFCIQLYKLGALGIMHRATSDENIIQSIKHVAKECDIVAGSIGLDQFDFAVEMIKNGCNVITIDIAHGYTDSVLELGRKIKRFSSDTKIIIGNATNVDIIYECYDFADAIKVGIAQGLACETKNTAGCTEKQFSAVLKFKHVSNNFGIPIISDGGIREAADFTKAIAAGANSVMAGSIFAACPESAAEETIVYDRNKNIDKKQKIYAGMASRYVQERWKGGLKEGTCPEGGIRYLDVGEPLDKLLIRYSGALKSGITYAGANDIASFQKNVEFIQI
jgi:IMP dehydrogenase/GMP reductase